MKISAFVALAGVSAQAPAGRIYFDEDLPCSDFDAMFPASQFPDMKTKCKTKFNEKKNKTKTRCNLICKNGQENVWSTRPIKVRSSESPFIPEKWSLGVKSENSTFVQNETSFVFWKDLVYFLEWGPHNGKGCR